MAFHYIQAQACKDQRLIAQLAPSNIRNEYENNFEDMTEEAVGLDELLAARDRMVRELQQGLSADERRFLLLLVAANPNWSLLGVEHLERLPALRWKLQNLQQLRKANPKKLRGQSDELKWLLA